MKSTGHFKLDDAKRALGTEAVRGSIWITNGVITKRIKQKENIPKGFRIGRL